MSHTSLFARLTSFPNLLLAAHRAQRGKRFRANVSDFTLNLEHELLHLQEELRTRAYRPGLYRTFQIRDKKVRLISAAPYRDRVVHHALCNVVEPIFDRGFLHDSYACRKGKGTLAAVERASAHARRFRYVLKCDMAQYFPSIDHQILLSLLARKIWDDGVLWLIRTIVEGSTSPPSPVLYFSGDDLFTPLTRTHGLPIGNQTSQFFGNVYLDGLDHYVQETLRIHGYVRYVDDFLVFGHAKEHLHEVRKAISQFCEGLRLRLHPRKCLVMPVTHGVTFLGHRIFPTYRRLDANNVRRFRRRLGRYHVAVQAGDLEVEQAKRRVQSWVAHAAHANTVRLRHKLLSSVAWAFEPRPTGLVPKGPAGRVVEQ